MRIKLADGIVQIGKYELPADVNADSEGAAFVGEKLFSIIAKAHYQDSGTGSCDYDWYRLSAEIRLPEQNVRIASASWENSKIFHRDAGSKSNPELAMALWANVSPTEYQLSNGEIFQPEPGAIVVARNEAVMHRMPPMAKDVAAKRWFFRQFVKWRE